MQVDDLADFPLHEVFPGWQNAASMDYPEEVQILSAEGNEVHVTMITPVPGNPEDRVCLLQGNSSWEHLPMRRTKRISRNHTGW